jgi:hypothetical protein
MSAAFIAVVALIIMSCIGVAGLMRGERVLACLLPFGVVLLLLAIRYGVIDNAPRVIMDDDGISAREWGWVKISWHDIRDASSVGMQRTGTAIVLAVNDEARYAAQLIDPYRLASQINKTFTGGTFSFNSTALNASNYEIICEIRQRIQVPCE